MHLTSCRKPVRLPVVGAIVLGLAALLADGLRAASPTAALSGPEMVRALHLAKLQVDQWHSEGFKGQGVKIAILDSGFRGYRTQLGKALPDKVAVRSFRFDGNLEAKDSQHGILCAEVIHALAPDAELLFANWEPDHSEQFLKAVQWTREQGARVISCSVIMPNWSDGEGGGAVHRALTDILGAKQGTNPVLFFASAGNIARRHWSGLFQDNGQGLHQWLMSKTVNGLVPWGPEKVSVELYGKTGSTYELIVRDQTSETDVGKVQTSDKGDRCSVSFRFPPLSGHNYQVYIRRVQGPGGWFHVVALGGALENSTAKGSVCFPADGSEVVAVGAVDGLGKLQAYSSCGSTICAKPDLVAPVPFPSWWRARPFGGTSAAAPQAAALAALCWSQHPEKSASEIRISLEKAAQDLGTPGYDTDTGYGLIKLPFQDSLRKRQ